METLALDKLTRWMRGLKPARLFGVSPANQAAARLAERLAAGDGFGEAARRVLPLVVGDAVAAAAGAFEGGPVALYIVDVRDGLKARLVELATAVEAEDAATGPACASRLRALACMVTEDTVEQHLVNAVLSATGAYAELMPLRPGELNVPGVTVSVADVLARALCLVAPKGELARRPPSMPPRPSRPELVVSA